MLSVYFVAALITFGVLHLYAAAKGATSRLFSTFVGGSTGGFSVLYFDSYTGVESLLTAAWNGTFGFYGTFMLLGLGSLLGVWFWNLFTTREYLVR